MADIPKTLVIAAHESHFRAFQAVLNQKDHAHSLIARKCVHVRSRADLLRIIPPTEVVAVGPYWTHPRLVEILDQIKITSRGKPLLKIDWFPLTDGPTITVNDAPTIVIPSKLNDRGLRAVGQ